jgi:hypothetical protein
MELPSDVEIRERLPDRRVWRDRRLQRTEKRGVGRSDVGSHSPTALLAAHPADDVRQVPWVRRAPDGGRRSAAAPRAATLVGGSASEPARYLIAAGGWVPRSPRMAPDPKSRTAFFLYCNYSNDPQARTSRVTRSARQIGPDLTIDCP